jgi:hypothetical protein
MSEARTVWHMAEARRSAVASPQRAGIMLAVCLLCAMTVAEVLFLHFVAGPDSVQLMVAAEGIAMPQ